MTSEHRFLPYLAPIVIGRPFLKRFRLTDASGQTRVRLAFDDAQTRRQFAVHVTRSGQAPGYLASTGQVDLALDVDGRPDHAIDTLVQALARLIGRNMQGLSGEACDALFAKHVPKDLNRVVGRRRIDLTVGYHCPSECTFCTDKAATGFFVRHDTATLFERLETARADGFLSVMFTGLEPTLRSDLPELIAKACALGFEDVQLITNGVRIAEPRYLNALLDAGLRVLTLSIHSADAAIEAEMTGVGWLFARKQKALDNIRRAFGTRAEQRKSERYFRTNSVLTRQNLTAVSGLCELLDRYQSSNIALNYPWLKGRAVMNFEASVPSYAEVVAALEPISARLVDPADPVTILNLPPCVAGAWGHRVQRSKNLSSEPFQFPAHPGQDDGRLGIHRMQMDPTLVYAPPCDGCSARAECPGVSKNYLRHFGELGLKRL